MTKLPSLEASSEKIPSFVGGRLNFLKLGNHLDLVGMCVIVNQDS